MKVYTRSVRGGGPELITDRRGQSGRVLVGQPLSVSFGFETEADYGLSVEKCWLSRYGHKWFLFLLSLVEFFLPGLLHARRISVNA